MAFTITKAQRLMIIIGISCSFFLAEIGVGFYTKSLALVADAFHYLNDLVGFIVALVAFKISERTYSPKELSFGWQRANLLGAFFNGVFLMALGVSILLQAIERFVSLQRVENPKLVLIVGCVGFALNVISAAFLHEHDHTVDQVVDDGAVGSTEMDSNAVNDVHSHTSHRHEVSPMSQTKGHNHDLGMMGVLLHVIGDAANNVGVIIAATVIWKASYPARFYADPAVSMAIALMILLSSIPLVRKTGAILMQTVPRGLDPNDVKHDIETISGVLAVHELHIWRLNQEKSVATAHIVVSDETMANFMGLANTINECFHAYGVHSATLQPELLPLIPSASEVQPQVGDQGSQGLRRRNVDDVSCMLGCRAALCEDLTCCG
ncbi:hypothetical protein LTR99_008163 [Exophiala xenobiotica]|uniref:Uncharacterized protein n=1 Tax=Vermiconidia calcicola TaxID=1690605 RepID=A0AAV9QHB9_9PEZI|nr:hypothetical protein LTR96_008559 [Exophiala xenobiotica]KAK5297760.1 hypothetical protein LTR99_008163 [Exophiala xenobiotica]KAK5337805.1 hypothetical protein LTR98_005654 [Exophiala xenobiotica]KAK5543482.1 hypothetical protein LTR25_001096 [Vermiconidia calcicola]